MEEDRQLTLQKTPRAPGEMAVSLRGEALSDYLKNRRKVRFYDEASPSP